MKHFSMRICNEIESNIIHTTKQCSISAVDLFCQKRLKYTTIKIDNFETSYNLN